MNDEIKPQFKTWKQLKSNLEYKTDVEKEVITEMARLVNSIVNERKNQNLTQRDLAEKAGITQAQVARLETSSSIPSIETVMKVAVALGMRIELAGRENAAAVTFV